MDREQGGRRCGMVVMRMQGTTPCAEDVTHCAGTIFPARTIDFCDELRQIMSLRIPVQDVTDCSDLLAAAYPSGSWLTDAVLKRNETKPLCRQDIAAANWSS
jgi:hypothetical protein